MAAESTHSCPSEEQLEAYVAGACTGDERAAIDAHLPQCARCRQYVDDARANQQVFQSVQRVMRRSGSGNDLKPGAAPGDLSIEGYEILEEIGRGGMGVVYKAIQTGTKRVVALKVMLDGPLASDNARRRFEREIELAASLSHANIVAIHDSGLSHGRYYFAMDYIEGRRLDRYVKDNESTVEAKLDLMRKVCQAIQYAHQRGVIHRDLKPSNILVDQQGEPHILDFGLAKTVASAPGESLLISISGEVLGTLPYMAPEQARGESHEIDCRTDVYALGVIFYEMLTGRYPYPVAGQMAEVLRNIAESEPARPSTIYRAIRNDLETIVLKTLSKDKESRYESAGALAADIARYVAGEAIEAKRDSGWYVLGKTLRHYKWPAGITAAFVLLAVGASIITFSLYRQATAARIRAAVEGRRAQENARQLAEELADRNIQAGRQLAQAGDFAQAESVLWTAFLQDPADPLALWSLREVYAQQPCMGKVRASRVPVPAIAFHPAGNLLATGDLQGVVKLWDMPGGRHAKTFITQAPDIISLCISPDGRQVATRSSDNSVRLMDLASGKSIYRWTAADAGSPSATQPADAPAPGINCRPAYSLAFSPDGRLLAGCMGNDVRLWDTLSGATLGHLSGHNQPVTTVAFSPDGKTLASGSKDRSIILWDVRSRKQRSTLTSHLDTVSCVAFSPDGNLIASASWDGSVILWQVSNGECLASLEGFGCWVHSVAFDPDGMTLAAGDIHGNIRLWDLASGKCTASIPAHVEGMQDALRPAVALAFQPQGDLLASTGSQGVVKLWDLARNRDMLKLAGAAGPVTAVSFDPDGKTLTSRDPEGRTRVWNLAGGQRSIPADYTEPPATTQPNSAGQSVSDWDDPRWAQQPAIPVRSPDGRLTATAAGDTIELQDASTATVVSTLRNLPGSTWSMCFSPDGKWLAAGGSQGARLWEVATGRCLPVLQSEATPVHSVAFSPDNLTLATAGSRTIRLWQVPSGRTVATLLGDGRLAWGLRFSPDGRLLACAGNTGLRIWDLARFDRCLLGNYAFYLEEMRTSPDLAARIHAQDVDHWAQSTAAAGEEPLWNGRHGLGVSPPMSHGLGVRPLMSFRGLTPSSEPGAPGSLPGATPESFAGVPGETPSSMECGGSDAALDSSITVAASGTRLALSADTRHHNRTPATPSVTPETIASWGQLTRHRLLFSLRHMGYAPLEPHLPIAGAIDPPPAALTFVAGSGLTKTLTITPSGLSPERQRSAKYQQQRQTSSPSHAAGTQPVAAAK